MNLVLRLALQVILARIQDKVAVALQVIPAAIQDKVAVAIKSRTFLVEFRE